MLVSGRPAAHWAEFHTPQAVLALVAPEGSKYDMWEAVVEAALALAVPEAAPQNDPLSALLRTLTALRSPSTGGTLDSDIR